MDEVVFFAIANLLNVICVYSEEMVSTMINILAVIVLNMVLF